MASPASADFNAGYAAYKRNDYATAFNEWLIPAEQGNVRAQYGLGILYEQGRGVPADFEEAMSWYFEAADRGLAAAQHRLGYLFVHGSEASQDLVEGYYWLTLAATDRRYKQRSRARRDRENLLGSMTSGEIAEAKRLVQSKRPNADAIAAAPPERRMQKSQPARRIERSKQKRSSRNRFVSGTRIAGIQRDLTALGFDPGRVDGVFGAKTREAILEFQAELELEETGEISDDLEAALRVARRSKMSPRSAARKKGRPSRSSLGSGFFVSTEGHILTAHHVVAGCREVHIGRYGRSRHVASDPQNDLALLVFGRSPSEPATFREGGGLRKGEELVVAGYPPQSYSTGDVTITEGDVSGLTGPGGDRRIIWTSVPVVPGNSGGPALDASGNVVGLIFAKLDRSKMDSSFDALPENVSFAISQATVQAFLRANGVPFEATPSNGTLAHTDIVDMAKQFTVPIECWD